MQHHLGRVDVQNVGRIPVESGQTSRFTLLASIPEQIRRIALNS